MISKNLEQILTKVIEEATSEFHEYLTVEHLLLGMANDSEGRSILSACGCEVDELKEQLEEHIKENVPVLPRSSVREPVATLSFQRVMDRLIQHIQFSGKTSAGPGDLLISILEEKESYAAYYFNLKGITKLDVMSYVSHGAPDAEEDVDREDYYESDEEDESPVKGDVLLRFATCLNDKAANGEIDPLIGRRAEVSRAIVIMNRRRKNNLIFVGEPGVGKTAIVEGIALRIHQKRVPKCLKDVKIYSIDISAMLAGTRYRGDFEARRHFSGS